MTISEFEGIWRNADTHIEAQTSGSTGKPKTIRLSKADMRASAHATNAFFGLEKGALYACPLDFCYIAARMMVVRAEDAAGIVSAIPPSNRFIIPYNVDLLAIVPSQVECLLHHPEWAATIKNVIIGGAPLNENLRNALIRCGYNAFMTYGMTETCSHVALRPLESECYKALPGITFEIDHRGCLVIDIPYFNDPHVVTNDIVDLKSPTEFIWIGRADNIINSGGKKLSPEDIESEIHNKANPRFSFYITSAPDPKWGHVPAMVAECPEDELASVIAKLREHMDHTRLPRHYKAVKAISRTTSGKIVRIPFEKLP